MSQGVRRGCTQLAFHHDESASTVHPLHVWSGRNSKGHTFATTGSGILGMGSSRALGGVLHVCLSSLCLEPLKGINTLQTCTGVSLG